MCAGIAAPRTKSGATRIYRKRIVSDAGSPLFKRKRRLRKKQDHYEYISKTELREKVLQMAIAARIIDDLVEELRFKHVREKYFTNSRMPLRFGMGKIGIANFDTTLQIRGYQRWLKVLPAEQR